MANGLLSPTGGTQGVTGGVLSSQAQPSLAQQREELLRQIQAIQEQQRAVQPAQQPQQGILAQGQTAGQFFTDPTQAQRSALLQAGLSILGADPTQSTAQILGQGLGTGLQTLQGARQTQFEAKQAENLAKRKTLQTELKDISAQFGLLGKQEELERAGQRFEAQQQAGEGEVVIDRQTGQQVRLIENPQGQLVDPTTGQPVDPSRFLPVPKTPLVQIGGGAFKVPTGFMLTDPSDPSKGVRPIPGGPQDVLTPEQAAKAQLVQGARENQVLIDRLLFDNGDVSTGQVDRTNIFTAGFKVPFTEGKTLNVLLKDSLEAKIRAESGAAVPETEITRLSERFMPSSFDSDQTIRVKRLLLKQFLDGTFDKFDPTGRFERTQTVDDTVKRMDAIIKQAESGKGTIQEILSGFSTGNQQQGTVGRFTIEEIR